MNKKDLIEKGKFAAIVFRKVLEERANQITTWGDQKDIPFGTGDETAKLEATAFKAHCSWLKEQKVLTLRAILTEEMMEVFAEEPGPEMEAELIQVMAVCLAFLERINGK